MEEKKKQIRKQNEAIAYLCQQIAKIHNEYNAFVIDDLNSEDLLDAIGKSSAKRMDILGDMLNSMDAVDPKDAFLDSIFEKADAMFPR